jgi:hypothetical protein
MRSTGAAGRMGVRMGPDWAQLDCLGRKWATIPVIAAHSWLR